MKRFSGKMKSRNRDKAQVSLRTVLAASACKITRTVLRRTGRGGTALPGRIAMLIKGDVLADTASGMEILVVTGTNGKTTTAHMLEHALACAGRSVLSNRSGANLLSGVTAEFAASTDRFGRPIRKTAVIECDEGALHEVVPFLHPKVVVVTNLFRDQLDRYGEVMHTRDVILEGIRLVPDAVLCLNADDSLVASLALEVPNPVLWFGLDTPGPTLSGISHAGSDRSGSGNSEADNSGAETAASDISEKAVISDARYCIRCGGEYRYHFHTYAHLGDFYCPICGYSRQKPEVAVTSIDRITADGTQAGIRLPEPGPMEPGLAEPGDSSASEDVSAWISAPAIYNLYNAAAAVSACRAAGYNGPEILNSLGSFAGGFGRMESFVLNGVRIQMILVKNPAGCNQAIEYLCSLNAPYTAVLSLNDLDADGHDVSWIWDAEYEKLCADRNLRRIYVWGKRAEDLKLRLKYAGVREDRIRQIKKIETLVQKMRSSPYPVFILPNYTTMLPLRNALCRQAGKREFWEG